jgi:hypothetical protein
MDDGMRIDRKWKSATALLACALLVGCSGEPNADDMLKAIQANEQFRASLMFLAMAADRSRSPDEAVTALMKNSLVEKSGCVAAQGAPGFMCDFRWGARQPDGKAQLSPPAKGRFFKLGDSWAVEIAR